MKQTNLHLEQFYKAISKRPNHKHETTITTFNRDIFWYNIDVDESQDIQPGTATYEDHRKAVTSAVVLLHKNTPHDIAIAILTHRFFKHYREQLFGSTRNFTLDYSTLLTKIDLLYNPAKGFRKYNNQSTLAFDKPTLVQTNFVTGEMQSITVPSNVKTLNEWAITFNANAPESTRYSVKGLQLLA